MTQKKFIPILVFIIVFSITVFFIFRPKHNETQPIPDLVNSQAANIEESESNFTASFEIYTNGTKRIFTDAMYHNQSDFVYIQNPDPSLVYVAQPNTTWDEFFSTLPFSLNKDCLVTGTKQTFCSNDTQKLRFYINDVEQPNALDLEIQPNDKFRVIYGN